MIKLRNIYLPLFVVLLVFPGASLLAQMKMMKKGINDPVVIDVHAHLFNGEDVPIDGFIEDIVMNIRDKPESAHIIRELTRPFAAIVKAWASGLHQDTKKLDNMLKSKGISIPAQPVTHTFNKVVAETDIQALSKQYNIDVDWSPVVNWDRIAGYQGIENAGQLKDDNKIKGTRVSDVIMLKAWMRRLTAPRYYNAQKLEKWHGRKGVDLFVPVLADMDYWLKGKTSSHLEDQVLITSKIALVNDGVFLPFVAFDPYRNLVDKGQALRLVKEAIMNYGFIGVKLYPSMGFKPIGNQASDYAVVGDGVWRNKKAGHPGFTDEEFARGIEVSLKDLYAWCEENDVPIMAHANNSNYSAEAFKNSSHPKHWDKVLTAYPKLKVNLSHFGGADSLAADSDKQWAQLIASLMVKHKNLYADTGNFKLEDEDGFRDYLVRLKQLMKKHPQLKDRLMYGSDWFMHVARNYSKDYPRKMTAWIKQEIPEFEKSFMGHNAVSFLGIENGENRKRLNKFYEHYGISPAWRERIDHLRVARDDL